MTAEQRLRFGHAILTVLMAVAGALVGAGSFLATTQGRISQAERGLSKCEDKMEALMPAITDIRERVIRIETRMEADRAVRGGR